MNIVNIDKAVTYINGGAIGVMLTDTVHGLVCRATEMAAVRRLYSLKQRSSKPGTVLVASADDALSLGVPTDLLKRAELLWPGPVSVVLPCLQQDYAPLHCGHGSLAIRAPEQQELRRFLQRSGPLLTSSANITAQPIAQSLMEVYDYFGDRVDFYLDAPWQAIGRSSTVLRLSDSDVVTVLRKGAMSQAAIEQILTKEKGADNDI